jgi:hypothetical protein
MNPNKTYIIQHKETKELFIARSGKSSWKQPGHAKNAFNQSMFGTTMTKYGLDYIEEPSRWVGGQASKRSPLFSEQDIFEVVELKYEAHSKLDEAINLLRSVLGRCDYQVHNEIVKFLESVE